MNSSRPIAAMALAVLLAACDRETPQEGEVSGEVLEGTISDEMLPLEQVRSRAPLADPTGSAATADGGAAADEPAPEAEEGPEAEPAVAGETAGDEAE